MRRCALDARSMECLQSSCGIASAERDQGKRYGSWRRCVTVRTDVQSAPRQASPAQTHTMAMSAQDARSTGQARPALRLARATERPQARPQKRRAEAANGSALKPWPARGVEGREGHAEAETCPSVRRVGVPSTLFDASRGRISWELSPGGSTVVDRMLTVFRQCLTVPTVPTVLSEPLSADSADSNPTAVPTVRQSHPDSEDAP